VERPLAGTINPETSQHNPLRRRADSARKDEGAAQGLTAPDPLRTDDAEGAPKLAQPAKTRRRAGGDPLQP
jgi:hypothetical protein